MIIVPEDKMNGFEFRKEREGWVRTKEAHINVQVIVRSSMCV